MRLRILAALVTFAVWMVLPPAVTAETNTPPALRELPLEELRVNAKKGDPKAQAELGGRYYDGRGVPKDEAEAVKWYRKAAEQEHVLAQYNLGVMYAEGRGVPKDGAEAVKWYRKAADQGNSPAQLNLGYMYSYGLGVPKDEAEAAKWVRKAAEQGNPFAQSSLGWIYEMGQGVAKDDGEAVMWYQKAAEQGNTRGQVCLGLMYSSGRGVAKDEAEAVKWYRKAAEQGDRIAQAMLGVKYQSGEGVPKDEAEAAKWYRKAAEQGNGTAQVELGYMYANGLGVIKDDVEAYKWYLLAGAQGTEPAKENISIIERRLTPNQRAEGQRLAREWKPRQEISTSSSDQIPEPKPSGSGSAFAITEDGYFITNEHVVEDGGSVRLLTSAGLLEASVVRVDKANDLALLKVEGRFPALPIAASRGVRLGATVATVGFPNPGLQGFAPKLAKGEIASLSGIKDDARHFQVSVPIQPGNSGGAMVDERGNVVGVIVAKLSQKAALATTGTLAENVNYAIKSSFLLGFLESVPEVASRLKDASTKPRPFEDVVQEVEKATALVLVH